MLGPGSRGPAVADWQTFLVSQGFTGINGSAIVADGVFGKNTLSATNAFQAKVGAAKVGMVDKRTLAAAAELGFESKAWLPADLVADFYRAKNFSVTRPAKIDLVVIHTMEAPKSKGRAKQVAQWFSGVNAPEASAHYCVDDEDVYQCVADTDRAWHAPGVNGRSIGIEHAGYAAQSEAEWLDVYNENMLRVSAKLVAALAKAYGIPVAWVDDRGLSLGLAGITGHANVTRALNGGKGHTDPGVNFPVQKYLALVRSRM